MKANILGYNNIHLIAIVWKKSRILKNCFCIMVLYRLSEKDKNKVFGGKYQMKIQNAFEALKAFWRYANTLKGSSTKKFSIA